MTDTEYMRLALTLAKKGAGWTRPNPMVGAVVVKNGRVIGQGYHQRYGELHAERNALASCSEDPAGATLYVTLEPCCHYGKTPPCTQAILDHRIARVVVGSGDPNPLVAGKGIAILRSQGISVTENVLKAQCDQLNRVFRHFIQTKTPYVTMKYAMTLDGKIATSRGASQWITGEEARARVQQDRHHNAAILVGVGTVLADNPRLTCRLPKGRNPLRIVCDSALRTPLTAQVVSTAQEIPTLLVTTVSDPSQHTPYQASGCRILVTPTRDGHTDLPFLMKELGAQGIDSLLLEGGGALNWSALHTGIVHRLQAYLAPKLFGGTGQSPVAGPGVPLPADAFLFSPPEITRLGGDLLLESEVLPCSPEL